jgi:ribonuclease R
VKVGRYMATQRGFGFVRVENEEDDIFIPGVHTKGALDGDTVQVLVKKEGGEGKRREGQVLNILERGNSIIVGTYTRSRILALSHRTIRNLPRIFMWQRQRVKGLSPVTR